MTQRHYYGNYEVVEDRDSQKYVATVKIHNTEKKIIVQNDALQVLDQNDVLPETVVHNIIKTPDMLKEQVIVSGANLDQYLD
ncbi:hypothetical protein [Latilactobacillus graminis]|nr:hypothetical protein [Latilactobacillus graminis]QFP79821.1 hypothetical protein LG542_05990 [Latilactobacillus graminis]